VMHFAIEEAADVLLDRRACATVYDHVQAVLVPRENRPDSIKADAWVPYCEIISDMLPSRAYCQYMTQDHYGRLLQAMIGFLDADDDSASDSMLGAAARTLAALISHYPENLDYNEEDRATEWVSKTLRKPFKFFTAYFEKINRGGGKRLVKEGVVANLLQAFNNLLRAQAMNSTADVALVIPPAKKYWLDNWTRSSPKIKDEMVQTMRIFMCLGYVDNPLLCQLAELAMDDIQQFSKPQAARSRDARLRLDKRQYAFCDFAADVFYRRQRLAQVRKTSSWPRIWANFSLLELYSHMNAWANLHLLGQPDSFLAAGGTLSRRRARRGDWRSDGEARADAGQPAGNFPPVPGDL